MKIHTRSFIILKEIETPAIIHDMIRDALSDDYTLETGADHQLIPINKIIDIVDGLIDDCDEYETEDLETLLSCLTKLTTNYPTNLFVDLE